MATFVRLLRLAKFYFFLDILFHTLIVGRRLLWTPYVETMRLSTF
jgi:hypothetical protein